MSTNTILEISNEELVDLQLIPVTILKKMDISDMNGKLIDIEVVVQKTCINIVLLSSTGFIEIHEFL